MQHVHAEQGERRGQKSLEARIASSHIGTSYRCKRCGQPLKGHVCTNPAEAEAEAGAEAAAEAGAARPALEDALGAAA
eukprot:scaffold29008_cov35-Phaeocystis_antarctica.AAC.2